MRRTLARNCGSSNHKLKPVLGLFDDLQKDILKQATQLGQSRRALSVTTPEVQSELATNAALLEFIRYDRYLGKTDFEQCYGLVLINHNNEPAWIPLGLATNIEANLHQYEALMRSRDRGNADILKTLYAQIMAPALKQLPAGVTNLIISPDAELNFLSFATLLDDHGEFVGEHYKVSYVASGRDLVFGKQVRQGNGQLAVFANADFNAAPVVMTNSHVTQLAMMDRDRRDYDGITLGALPGTGNEAEYLRSHSPGWKLNSSVYLGAEAIEARVKALHSPYILHLATHGFFLPDNAPTNQNHRPGPGEKLPVVLSNPMQRSGLALVGAQKTLVAWSRGEVPDTENDGILMADEVSLLDLQNTWLVTLSACDTGIGEARAGEGVMGLRRGFIQAGAQNLLMTLWPVSDKWTTDLMEAFYQRALQTKDAPGALAEVQGEYLKRLRLEKNAVLAARLAGPFVMNFQGKPGNN
jgi:CHAT domain-containing protein